MGIAGGPRVPQRSGWEGSSGRPGGCGGCFPGGAPMIYLQQRDGDDRLGFDVNQPAKTQHAPPGAMTPVRGEAPCCRDGERWRCLPDAPCVTVHQTTASRWPLHSRPTCRTSVSTNRFPLARETALTRRNPRPWLPWAVVRSNYEVGNRAPMPGLCASAFLLLARISDGDTQTDGRGCTSMRVRHVRWQIQTQHSPLSAVLRSTRTRINP